MTCCVFIENLGLACFGSLTHSCHTDSTPGSLIETDWCKYESEAQLESSHCQIFTFSLCTTSVLREVENTTANVGCATVSVDGSLRLGAYSYYCSTGKQFPHCP